MGTNLTTRNLKEDAVYWPPDGESDGFGRKDHASSVAIKVRWEERVELFIDATGEERQSNAVIRVDRVVENGGFLFLGTVADFDSSADPDVPQTNPDAWQILRYDDIPRLKKEGSFKRAFV